MLPSTPGGNTVGSDAAVGGADRRSAKNAAAPMSTAKRTTRRGRTLPERVYSPGRSEPTGDRP